MKKTDLSGRWEFCLDGEKKGIGKGYYGIRLADNILLPGTVSEAGKGIPSQEEQTGYLTDPYLFEGYAWYSREIEFEGEQAEEVYLVLERTRISHVWLGNQYMGSNDSLCTAHRYRLTPYAAGKKKLTIMIDNTSYPVKGGHMTSPDTQTNWNGITGEIYLEKCSRIRLTGVQIYPDAAGKRINTRVKLCGTAHGILTAWVTDGERIFPQREYTLEEGENNFFYDMDETAIAWSEHTPHLYQLQLSLHSDRGLEENSSHSFGLRDFKAAGRYFEINGVRTFLRGKHDGMIFPLTGYAPADTESWLKVMTMAKQYGINHYRFHTCCPPEAAFAAADQLGIYMEPELPFWGTVTREGEEGHDAQAQQYLIDEGFRILDEFGNHPSFVMMSLGNELWGSRERLDEILLGYRRHDSRHLYTQGSNNFQFMPCILENEDFYCGVRFSRGRLFRGSYAMCDAPQGHIQTKAPDTVYNYDQMIRPDIRGENPAADMPVKASMAGGEVEIQYGTGIKTVKAEAVEELIPEIPVVSHEIGQYAMYPDFSEIAKYTGVLKARNLEVFQRRLEEKMLLFMADDFFRASGRFAAECYKAELETALRSKELAGFQILDLQDFTGQGTALVGILNSFMESKGILSDRQWRQFCSDGVLLAELPGMVYAAGEKIRAGMKLTVFRREKIRNPKVVLSLSNEEGELLTQVNQEQGEYFGGVFQLSDFLLELPVRKRPERLELNLSLEGTEICNCYTLWIYPKDLPKSPSDPAVGTGEQEDVLITGNTGAACQELRQGRKVLLYPEKLSDGNSLPGTYCTDFWCYPMFRSISEGMKKPVPVGTHGLFIHKEKPVFEYFPVREYTTPQWYDIVTGSRALILDEYNIKPLVWTIDNFERNHRLGNLLELRVGSGRLLICTRDLRGLPGSLPARWLEYSILHYMSSADFNPEAELGEEELLDILNR